MRWEKLIYSKLETMHRGTLLKFKAGESFEEDVVMMVCEGFANAFDKCLITITGYKAGINCYVVFPKDEINGVLTKEWLIKNWTKWVWPDGDIEDVFVRESLSANEL